MRILIAALALFATGANAQSGVNYEGLSLAARASTLGVGLELKYPFFENIYGRLVLNQHDYDTTEEISDTNYKIDLELGTYGLIGDWHPAGNGFRLSAGLLSNDNKVKARTADDTFEFGDETYTGSARAEADFDSLTPFIGLGYSNQKESGWGFDFEVGLVFQGDVSLSGSGSATGGGVTCNFSVNDDGVANVTGGAGGNCMDSMGNQVPTGEFEDDIETEHADLVDDLEDLETYPVISFGIQYRF